MNAAGLVILLLINLCCKFHFELNFSSLSHILYICISRGTSLFEWAFDQIKWCVLSKPNKIVIRMSRPFAANRLLPRSWSSGFNMVLGRCWYEICLNWGEVILVWLSKKFMNQQLLNNETSLVRFIETILLIVSSYGELL